MEDLLGGAEVKQKGPVDTSLYGQLWTHGLKQGLGLPAPRMAFTQQQYLYFNQPTGSVFPILTDAALDGAQNLLAQQVRDGQPVQCHQPQMSQYSYAFDSDRSFPITACFGMSLPQLVSPDTNALFIKTMARVQVEHTRDAPSSPSTAAQCVEAMHTMGVHCNSTPVTGIDVTPQVEYRLWGADGQVRPGQGSCWCRVDESTLTVDPESLQLELDHSFSSSWGGNEVRAVVPQTHVRLQDSLKDLAVFEAGTPPSASVAQWLKWAQVDLDQRINTPPNLQWLPKSATEASDHPNSIQGPLGHAAGLWPYPRVTGLELKMSFDYYNYRRAPGVKYKWNWKVWEGARNAPPVCIVTLKPVMGWQLRSSQPKADNTFPLHLHTQTIYRAAGVLVSYQVGGEIAFFSLDVLLKVVTNSIVLLGLCGTVCVMICRYGMGAKSRFYSNIIIEKVSVSRTYAQFAVRMIVASIFFDIIDDNASGEISKGEIFEKLRRLLQGKSTLEQTASLVEFMMEAADTGLVEEAMETATEAAPVVRGSAFDEDVENEDDVVGTDDMDTIALQMAREPEEVEPPREATINREEWVNIFVGPPCTVDRCVELIRRKNSQGRYLIGDDDLLRYKRLDKKIRAEYRETQAAAERGDLETQVPLHLTKRKAARLFRRQKDQLELFVKQTTAAKRDLQKVSKTIKALHHTQPATASSSNSVVNSNGGTKEHPPAVQEEWTWGGLASGWAGWLWSEDSSGWWGGFGAAAPGTPARSRRSDVHTGSVSSSSSARRRRRRRTQRSMSDSDQ